MIKTRKFPFLIVFIIVNYSFSQNITLPEKAFSETFFGTTIHDPYRYMENSKDTLVQQWFKQNSLKTRNVLDHISGRDELMQKFKEFGKRRSYSILQYNITDDNQVFYIKKTDDDKRYKLYCKANPQGTETLLYDPLEYKKESGSEYSISYIKPSWNSKYIAISFSKKGAEIAEVAFLDVTTKKLLPEIITNCWPAELGGINWLPNDSGIVYIHLPVVDTKDKNYILNGESVIYKLGENPLKRKVVFSKNNNPTLNINSADFPIISSYDLKDQYILGYLGSVSQYNDVFYASIQELENDIINWQPLYKKEDGFKSPIVLNDEVYCLSTKSATNFSIIKTSIIKSDFKNPTVVVAENKKEAIDDYVITADGLYYTTTQNGVIAKLYSAQNGNVKSIPLPIKAGKIVLFSKNKTSSDVWLTLNGWLNPNTRYKYDAKQNKFTEDNLSPVPSYPEFKDFVVEEIEVTSHDGALVPVTLIYNKELKKNKNNSIFMTGYGAYGISIKPNFQTIFLSWVLNGGVFVSAHVRGGGEKGEDWHKAGFKSTKSNTWKDLIAIAEYLIKEKITSKSKIAISGASAGGILVSRAVTERPDLFKVMICDSGDLNSSRIKDAPNGPNNMKEFGNPDIEAEFNGLLEMDSYQHIKRGVKYPACLLSVGMNDARVAPWISGKFTAKLTAANTSNNPILLAVDYDSGHGTGKSNLTIYNDFADRMAFAFWQMGHPKFKLTKK
jgi:prolyl oligopeptidase